MAEYSPQLYNGAAATYTYTFTTTDTDYINVALRNANGTFDNIPTNGRMTGWEEGDPEYPWTLNTATSTITMTGTQFPAGTGNVSVFRDTDLDDLPITFNAGSALSAAQLNENFQLLFDALQEVERDYMRDGNAALTQVLDAGDNRIINVADGTADNDAVNLGQLNNLETDIEAQVQDAEDAAELAEDWATSLEVVANDLRGARFYANQAQTQRDWIEDNDGGVLRDTIFMGFRRQPNGDLLIDYPPAITVNGIDRETGDDDAAYEISDYANAKDGEEIWQFMPASSVDQGTNLPRFSFNTNGFNAGDLIYDL